MVKLFLMILAQALLGIVSGESVSVFLGDMCHDGFDDLAARVYCRTFMDGVLPIGRALQLNYIYSVETSTGDTVQCSGEEEFLSDCVQGRRQCKKMVVITCSDGTEPTVPCVATNSSVPPAVDSTNPALSSTTEQPEACDPIDTTSFTETTEETEATRGTTSTLSSTTTSTEKPEACDPIDTTSFTEMTEETEATSAPNRIMASSLRATAPVNNTLFTCGIKHTNRIINGYVTEAYEYPWMVYIDLGGQARCSGVIISEKDILTAAHCVAGSSPLNLFIAVHWPSSRPDFLAVKVVNKVIHEKYDTNFRLVNDIALLELEEPLVFNKIVLPVCLPEDAGNLYENSDVITTGWGETEPYIYADTLQYADMTTVNNYECCYETNLTCKQFSQSSMCTKSHLKAICASDAGGPLVYEEYSGYYTLVGIATYSIEKKCALGERIEDSFQYTDFYSMFARVTEFLPWIKKNMAGTLASRPN